jgi:NAD(P)-dependent dehydrogenase (short-subunit alcohol dehydrogenase family)
LDDTTALVIGGSGTLGGAISEGLAKAGAGVAVLGRSLERAQATAERIQSSGGEALAVSGNILDKSGLVAALETLEERWPRLDLLVNAAGGNRPEATTGEGRSFFQLSPTATGDVMALNYQGVFNACQVFGLPMAREGKGAMVNISSMAAFQPLTRVPAYSAAKAALSNFTRWLAVHMAQEYSPRIRVNAIAPGFFIGEQNRYLLFDKQTGELTPRGKSIIDHTPMGRFGQPEELVGTVIWLASRAAQFVTGTVVPVDGGFSAFGGV